MTKQDRATLKSFFRSGALPTAAEYRDLIDSTVNQVDDGFAKTDADGLRLNSVGSSLRVLSLYQGLGTPKPSWVLEHGDAPGALHFRPDQGKSALEFAPGAAEEENTADGPGPAGLSITRDGRVGVAHEAPDWRLDVDGVARMRGRIGVTSHRIPHVRADGKWHDITQPLTGCQCFEVTAGTGGEPRKGRYSMMHAIAMNAYHPRNPILNWLFRRRSIKTQTAMYGSYADRLRLRWVADTQQHHFRLQLRTNANFGEGKVVRYYLTQLWFDSMMTGAREDSDRDAGLL
ncbi:hypothetical protein [uncultured Roseobacter sp.]|uniref:hypothetical protein n=1 Tax=uncultured Roseobacter sp. TaxID=114847 RepID=UPI0026272A36|nr:hypothetical protein [uncultured Roseobacter sp.]